MENKHEEPVEKGQEINAQFRDKREPDSAKALDEDLVDPEIYREKKVNSKNPHNKEWPAREFTNRDRPSREKRTNH